jgi:hypothetical protein
MAPVAEAHAQQAREQAKSCGWRGPRGGCSTSGSCPVVLKATPSRNGRHDHAAMLLGQRVVRVEAR